MSMKKKLFFAAIAFTALAGCTDESYVGDQSLLENNGGAISFNMKTPAITRAEKTGSDAATLLDNNFVFYGYKTMTAPATSPQTVFDNYQANFVNGSANTTESNSAGWEYVSYKNLPFGTTTALNGDLNNNGVKKNASESTTNVEQSIKYWDFNATQYDFFAYSLGKGDDYDNDPTTTPLYAKASALSTSSSYTLSGTAKELGTCYISKKKSIVPSSSSPKEVDLEFVSFLSKIQLGFYEAIPGYSVKDVKFYVDADNLSSGDATKDGLKPALFGASDCIPRSGTYTITFDGAKPVATLTSAGSATEANVQFPAVTPGSPSPSTWLSGYANKEYNEAAEAIYLGRTSSNATSTSTLSVLPNSVGATLTLKIDYTMVSRDGTGENIQVTGKTATVPANFTKWMSNYAYTYIFKITDDQLVPITLDAVVVDDEDGVQETITTIYVPSITTYSAGKVITDNDEYKKNKNIYIVVNDGTSNVAMTINTDALLYTAEIESGAAQGITEETVKNAIAANTDGYDFGTVLETNTILDGYWTYNSGTNTYAACASDGKADGTTKYYKPLASGSYSVRDANGKKLVVKGTNLLALTNQIPAADSPTGNDFEIGTDMVAYFTPTTAGYYAFQYKKEAQAAVPAVYTAVANDATYSSETTYYTFDGTNYTAYTGEALNFSETGTTYYTESGGVYTAVTPGTTLSSGTYYTWNGSTWTEYVSSSGGETNGTSYYTMTPAVPAKDAINQFKVIKVVD